MRPPRTFSADQTLAMGIGAAHATYSAAESGVSVPLATREFLLLAAMREIAEGRVLIRNARTYAQRAVDLWASAYQQEQP